MKLIGKILRKTYEKVSNKWYRTRLKNDNFTILTDTCIGGVMYHKLGKRFMSPTINMWMNENDFYRFVHNLHHYLAQPLRFVHGIDPTPTAYIDDILLRFNHYHSDEEARAKWEERLKRINYDNLFIICADRADCGPITHEDMLSLKEVPCRGKVIFSVRKYDDIDYIVPLPKDKEGDYVNSYMFDRSKYFQQYRWEEAFDWVEWLNSGRVILKS